MKIHETKNFIMILIILLFSNKLVIIDKNYFYFELLHKFVLIFQKFIYFRLI